MTASPWSNGPVTLYTGHAWEVLQVLPAESVQCVVTSPPYWRLRDYGLEPMVWDGEPGCEHEWDEEKIVKRGHPGQLSTLVGTQTAELSKAAGNQGATCHRCGAWRGSLGLEPTPHLYVRHLVAVFREVRRVLRSDGVCFLNLGDSYAGSWGNYHPTGKGGQRPKATERFQREAWGDKSFKPPMADAPGLKPKDLIGITWRVALALQEDGWWLRSDIIWAKPNPMPESVQDRPTRSHEYIFLLTKSADYFWDQEAVREAGAGRLDVGEMNLPHRLNSGGPWPGVAKVPNGRNLRSVWSIATQPMTLEWCKGCGKVYSRAEYAYLRLGATPRCQTVIDQETDEKCGGTDWDVQEDGLLLCLGCETAWPADEVDKFPKAKRCNRCKGDQWGSHFATFPEELVERCILAGTSEQGCCPECGAPWERVVSPREAEPSASWKGSAFDDGRNFLNHPNVGKRSARGSGNKERKIAQEGERGRLNTHMGSSIPWTPGETPTVGWRPACAHADLAPVPCTVLDPFSGAGTVAVVAQKLGRRGIGVDLSPQYTALAVKRLEEVPLPMGGG